jgi:hypothetical protein
MIHGVRFVYPLRQYEVTPSLQIVDSPCILENKLTVYGYRIQMEVTMNTVIYIGIDVQKDSYTLSSFLFTTGKSFGQSKIGSSSNLVKKYVTKLQKEYPGCDVLCGYEAGPTISGPGTIWYTLRDYGTDDPPESQWGSGEE